MSVETVRRPVKHLFVIEKVCKCDVCGTKRAMYSCIICKRDVCIGCSHDEYEFGSDYPDHYCRPCWEIGEVYRNKIEQIELAADLESECVRKKWVAAAKEQAFS